MYGPVVHPLLVDSEVAIKMVMSGYPTLEYDPNTKTSKFLTLESLSNRGNEEATINDTTTITEPVIPITENTVNEVKSDNNTLDNTPSTSDVTPGFPETRITAAEFAESYEFVYNADGTVDESKINWSELSKSRRKALKARIEQINAEAHKE
jgi:hypothetical protein